MNIIYRDKTVEKKWFITKKISTLNAKGIIAGFIIKDIILSVIAVALFTAIFSFAVYKLDCDLKYCRTAGYAVLALSSFIISYFSAKGIKSNIMTASIISVLPLIIFSVINSVILKKSIPSATASVIIIILVSVISSIINAKR